MALFSFFKKDKKEKKETRTAGQIVNKKAVEGRYSTRIENLKNEFEILFRKLKELESNSELSKIEKDRESSRMIKKMTFIIHEVEIREELLKWL